MKKWVNILSIGLSLLIIFNILRVSITFAYYKIDPIGFIEALCENKDKPELKCNGKCELKKVTESSRNNEKAPSQLIDFKDILLYKEAPFSYSFRTTIIKNENLFLYLNNYSYLQVNSSFHPPQL